MKRGVTYTVIVIVSASAMTIVAIVLGDFEGEAVERLLATSGLIIAFTLTWLLSAMPYERGILRGIGVIGMAASPVALALALLLVWGVAAPTSFDDVKPALVASLVAAAFAYASVLVLPLGRHREVDVVIALTAVAVFVLALLLVVLVLSGSPPGPAVGRALGSLSALAVLGTFLVPLLLKLRSVRARETGR